MKAKKRSRPTKLKSLSAKNVSRRDAKAVKGGMGVVKGPRPGPGPGG